MKCSSLFPIPFMNSVFSCAPILGAGSICSCVKVHHLLHRIRQRAENVLSPSTFTSTMMMQVFTVFSVLVIPNFSLMSTTGTTLPRRLITPRMNSGVRGTFVIVVKSRTSRTFEMSSAKTSSSSLNVRYCVVSDLFLLRPYHPP